MGQGRKKRYRVRYDRIILITLLPVVLVFSIIMIVKDNTGENSESDNEIEEFMPVIYLSPSNQIENNYSDGGTTEAEAMRAVSKAAAEYLKNNNIEVHIAEPKTSLKEKVKFSNENNLTAHIAIHSNTGNGIKNMGGTTCYYNSEVEGSKELSDFIYSKVSTLTPTDDHGMSDATKGATYQYEIAQSTTPSCMIEVEYHDSIKNARWIIENTDEIGKSIAEGIMQYVEFARKQHYQSLPS